MQFLDRQSIRYFFAGGKFPQVCSTIPTSVMQILRSTEQIPSGKHRFTNIPAMCTPHHLYHTPSVTTSHRNPSYAPTFQTSMPAPNDHRLPLICLLCRNGHHYRFRSSLNHVFLISHWRGMLHRQPLVGGPTLKSPASNAMWFMITVLRNAPSLSSSQ